MRIQVAGLEFAARGGLELVSRNVVTGLRELGHDVRAVAFLERTGTPDVDGIRVDRRYPASRIGASLFFRTLDLQVARYFRRMGQDVDLVVCAHRKLAVGANRGLKRSGTAYWVWAHGDEMWGKWSPQLEAALRGAQRIVAVSDYTAAHIRQRLDRADVLVVFPWIGATPAPRGAPPSPERDPVMLMVSRLTVRDRYKGHDMVIESLPLIERRLGRRVELRVVGGGDGVASLTSLARKHGVGDRVHFLGPVDDATLADEYEGCDLFVMPSRMDASPEGSMTGEGFGIVYIEAQAAGRPVVASNEAAAPGTIREGETGFAVDPRSPEAIADACARILALPDRGRSMGYAGWEFVQERFGHEAFLERLSALLARR
jgi:glycosyltransferase involved in cell wall biosynthesis